MERGAGSGRLLGSYGTEMTHREQTPQRPSILRFTRTMAGPLRQKFPVDSDDPGDEFTDLLKQAERRREIGETANGD